jgi:monoamine oxidase
VTIKAIGPEGQARDSVHAKAAVITLPLGVLRAAAGEMGAVRFEPEIPQKQEAVSRLEMGSVVKILLQFSSAFWEEMRIPTLPKDQRLDQMAFLHTARIPFATWWNFFPVRSTILVGWAGGPSAFPLIGKSNREILQHALASLSRILGLDAGQLEPMIQKFWICDWQTDPFARGAYSYVPVGAVDAVAALAKPVEQTLFFAGEATDAEGFGGTVDSALASGRRAAKEILAALA